MKHALLLLLCLAGSAFADSQPLDLVIEGLNSYCRSGGNAAVETWQKGSVREGFSFVEEFFAQTEKLYGRVLGFETIRVVPVSASMQRAYILLKYERGPAYLSFDCYKPDSNWIISTMHCDTKPGAVLPERLMVGTGR